MLLSSVKPGTMGLIKKITEEDNTTAFLLSIGLAEGATVKVVAKFNGNMIIGVKNSRIALAESLAKKIYVYDFLL